MARMEGDADELHEDGVERNASMSDVEGASTALLIVGGHADVLSKDRSLGGGRTTAEMQVCSYGNVCRRVRRTEECVKS